MSKRKVKARQKKRVRRKLKGRDLNGYRSGFEVTIAQQLRKNQKKQGFHWGYESDKFEYSIVRTYTPDFFVTTKSGKLILIEAKGRFLSSDRTKHKALKAQRPDLDIRFVFMRDQYVSKAKKTKYSDWCRQHGFKYNIGEIDKEWLDE